MNQLRCDICSVDFKEARCYRAHLKSKKHKNNADNKIENIYKCPCGKSYIHRQSLHNHKKICSYKKDIFTHEDCNQTQINTDSSEQTIQILRKENQEMREFIS